MRTRTIVANLGLGLFMAGCWSGQAYLYAGAASAAFGDRERAESLLNAALPLLKSENAVPGRIVDCLLWLADSTIDKGRYEEAGALLQQAADALADCPPSSRIAAKWVTLAQLQYAIANSEEAAAAARHALEQLADPGTNDAKSYASAKYLLGSVLLAKGEDIAVVEGHFRAAIELLERTGNDKTTHEIDCLGGLASCCVYRGEYGEAEALLNRAVALDAQVSAGDDTVDLMNSLGLVNLYQGKIPEAEPYFDKARTALAERKEAPRINLMLPALEGKAYCLFKSDKADEAKPLLEQVVELIQRSPRPDERRLAKTLIDLGYTCSALGDDETARKHFARSFEIYKRVCGTDTDETKRAEEALASLSQ